MQASPQAEETAALVCTYRELTSVGPVAAGAAALYAYESQVPEVAAAKLQGLREFTASKMTDQFLFSLSTRRSMRSTPKRKGTWS